MGRKATIENQLAELEAAGCYPAVSRSGPGVWRAHVNQAGNFWDEADSPWLALAKAKLAWEKAGRPLDGAAQLAWERAEGRRANSCESNR